MIYVDNAATTRLSDVAFQAMLPYLKEQYGNPSSLHTLGQQAARGLSRSRSSLARCLHCSPGEILFTSGGTEADVMALSSAAAWGRQQGRMHILSTAFEHHAVLRTLEQLSAQGFQVQLLDVRQGHTVTPQQVASAIRPDTCLVTAMYANNEIGSILPIAEIGTLCRRQGVLFHTDAVQAVGHLPIDVQSQCIDYLSLSAHKFHGPKGVGALYCRKGVPLQRLLPGGGQERGFRAGTENLPAIVGMAAALEDSCTHMEDRNRHIIRLRDRLIHGLCEIPHSVLSGSTQNRLPGNVHFCFEGISGESLLLLLDQQGICAGAGSACSAGSLEASHVLLSLGLPRQVALGALRLSLSHENTTEDVDRILAVVPEVVTRLRRMSPLWQDMTSGKKPFLL